MIYSSTLENVLVILFAERVIFSVFMWWNLVYEQELFQWWFHMKVGLQYAFYIERTENGFALACYY